MIVSAHLGHWYVQLAFAGPALALIAYMTRDSLRRRRQGRTQARQRNDPPPPDARERFPAGPRSGKKPR